MMNSDAMATTRFFSGTQQITSRHRLVLSMKKHCPHHEATIDNHSYWRSSLLIGQSMIQEVICWLFQVP